MRRETFTTAQAPRLQLRLPAGAIEIATADTAETVVELEPLNARARRIIDEVTVVEVGGAIRVDVSMDGSLAAFRQSPAFRVTVRTPHGARVDVEAAAADLTARGRYAEVGANSASGRMRVDAVDGAVVVAGASGDIEIASAGGDVDVRTVSGDVAIGSVGGGLRLETVSGDARADSIAGPAISANSVSGDLRLGVREGSSVFLDVSSLSGHTVSELEAADGPAADGETVEVRARSVSGDIRIVRGGAAHARARGG